MRLSNEEHVYQRIDTGEIIPITVSVVKELVCPWQFDAAHYSPDAMTNGTRCHLALHQLVTRGYLDTDLKTHLSQDKAFQHLQAVVDEIRPTHQLIGPLIN